VILIWSWRVRLKTLSRGVFYSPATGHDGPYRLVEARRWFTFFWIPLIPLKRLGTFVECEQTKTTYEPSILERPTNADFEEQLSGAVREAVVAVIVADGTVTDAERRLALAIIQERVGAAYDAAALDDDIARAPVAPLDDRLRHLASSLNEQGKERLLSAAARVTSADGAVDDRARTVVQRIGQLLEMSPAHVRGVVAAIEDDAFGRRN
jgi:uncharacterized tellurite resistance protein B-like protein